MRRIVYQDWIVELGRDPSGPRNDSPVDARLYNHEIIGAVNKALERLNTEEAEFTRLYYMQGMDCRSISRKTGKPIYRLEALQRRALRKIKTILQELLGGRYHVPFPAENDCPLCRHPRSDDINRIIQSRPKAETWRPIVKILRDEFGLVLPTLQLLVGHSKYHIP